MKKVLSFVLVLSMILGSFGMAFAATDVEGSEYKDALTVLLGLGVIEGYTDGTVKPEKVVTRAEAATLIIKAMDLQDYAVGKSAFTDMAGHWADAFVAYAVSLGFVAGNTDGTFAPDAPVTSDQMITMLVQAIGYKGEYLTGGYPGAFVNTAKALGMLKDVKSGATGCTRGEVAQMIYNSLKVSFVSYDKDGGLQDAVIDGDCMFNRLIDVEGVVADTIVKANEDSKIDLKPYQGLKATLIKDNGDVVAVDDIKSVFIEGKLSADAKTFELADETEYKFHEDVVSTTAVTYFNNGKYNTTTTSKALSELTGASLKLAVKLDGKYVKELHSIAKWDATGTVMWDEALAEEVADEDAPKLSGAAFAMTTKDEIDTTKFVLEGAASLDKIPEDAIVTYYVAKNEIVKVAVSTTVVEGKVTEITKDSELVIGGKAYDVATGAAVVEVEPGDKDLGSEGKFYLNAAGEIAYADTAAAEADDYAIVLKNASKEAIGYDADDSFKIKLLTADNKRVVMNVTKKCFNEKASDSSITVGALVAYTLNKDGEINDIVLKSTGAAFVSEAGIKLSAKGYLAGYKVAKDVVVFEAATGDDAPYVVADMKAVAVDEALNATKYLLNSDKEVAVILTADVESETGIYGMVVSYSEVQNADEENVYKVTLAIDGKVQEPVLTVYGESDFANTDLLAHTSFCAFTFEGGELKAVEITEGATAATAGAVKKVQDGNVALTTSGAFEAVAADVVVYEVAKDGAVSVSSFAKVVKNTNIEMYQLDAADKDEDGYDVIIIRK